MLPWRSSALFVLAAVLSGGVIAIWLLWAIADGLSAGTTAHESALLRLDAVKTGLTVAAGIGAMVTLLLALRRQALSERAQRFAEEDSERRQTLAERAQRHTEADAEERRITELYVQSVDQIGSDKAPVRLGGLYALDRLGDTSPLLRPTIIEVYCAYLRMPFTPVSEGDDHARHEELQVRLAAQHLILKHCSPYTHGFWGMDADINLNLGGATLVGFRATGCQFGRATLDGALFVGETNFDGAKWSGEASFDRVSFTNEASYAGAAFGKSASFRDATFKADAWFTDVTFAADADFHATVFDQEISFAKTRFSGVAAFAASHFGSHAQFAQAAFESPCDFRHAYFEDASFRNVSFAGMADFNLSRFFHARFTHARFDDAAGFGSATFAGDADFRHAQIKETAYFRATTFLGAFHFDGMELQGTVDFEQARSRSRQEMPAGWRVSAHAEDEGFAVVRMNVGDRSE